MLELADHLVGRPDRIIKDVLVQVGSLIFPMGFVILYFELVPKVPFILGCLFLVIGGALIDFVAKHLTKCAHNKLEVFDIYQTLTLPSVFKDLATIIVFDVEVAIN